MLPETSPLGSVLAGLFGYRSAPTVLEVIGYLAYLIPVLVMFVFGGRAPKAAAAAASVALALVLAGCGTGGGASSAGPSAAAAAGGTTVEVAASEYKFDPDAITAPAGSVVAST